MICNICGKDLNENDFYDRNKICKKCKAAKNKERELIKSDKDLNEIKSNLNDKRYIDNGVDFLANIIMKSFDF
jgi:hypothetical protein